MYGSKIWPVTVDHEDMLDYCKRKGKMQSLENYGDQEG